MKAISPNQAAQPLIDSALEDCARNARAAARLRAEISMLEQLFDHEQARAAENVWTPNSAPSFTFEFQRIQGVLQREFASQIERATNLIKLVRTANPDKVGAAIEHWIRYYGGTKESQAAARQQIEEGLAS